MSSHLKPAVPALAIITGVLMLATANGFEIKSAGPLSCGTLSRTGHEQCHKSCASTLAGESFCQWRCDDPRSASVRRCV